MQGCFHAHFALLRNRERFFHEQSSTRAEGCVP
jgi:hypothetical protein